jgi:PAS domain S-box-containing protein
MPEDEARRTSEISHSILASRKPFTSLENVNLHKDGHEVIIETSGVPIFDKDGNFLGYRGIDRYITERVQAEEEQQKLVSIIESSSDLIGFADLDGNLLYLNTAGQKLVGIENIEDVLNKSVAEFHMGKDFRKFMTEILPSILQAGAWTGEIAFRHFITREPIPVEMNAFIIRDKKNERPIALANISRNITDRKKAEEEINQRVKELEEFYDMAVGRELRMIELRKQIDSLKEELEQYKKQKPVFES